MENKKVDVLLIEGTMLGRLDEEPMSEEKLQEEAKKLLMKPLNMLKKLVRNSFQLQTQTQIVQELDVIMMVNLYYLMVTKRQQ